MSSEYKKRYRRYRGRLDIFSDILSLIKQKGKITQTGIMHRGNLSFDQLKRYLDELLKLGLIEKIAQTTVKLERTE